MLVGMTTDLVPSIGYSTNNSGMLLGNPSQTEECSPEVATIECFENFIHSFVEPDFEFIPLEILRIIVMIVPVFYVESQDIHCQFNFDFLNLGFRYFITPAKQPANIGRGSLQVPSS